MKKLLALTALSVFLVSVSSVDANAGTLRNNIGCGVGTMAFEGKGSEDAWLTSTAAATTNAIFYNQMFGITSGTLGCIQPTKIASSETFNFVALNMDNLAKDIAMGHGESVETLAELMGISTDKKVAFMATLQTSFSDIYTHDAVEPGEVLDNIHAVIG